MADERCETCGADVSQMGSGGLTPPDPFTQHLTDFSDPHRTLDLVAKKYYGITAPVVDPNTYRPDDWYFNLDNGNGYVFKVTNDGYEWRLVISPTHVDIDLTQYATKAWVEAGFVSTSYASEHFLTQSSLSNYVTSAAMTSALASYATRQHVAEAISSSGHMTMAEADLRYMRAASDEDQFVSRSQLTSALAAYTPSSNLATYLQLSNYLTIASADAADGFARKSALAQLDFVTPAALSSALSSYATQSWVGNLGYLTQAAADLRYLQTPAVPYITAGYVTNALSAYTPTSGLASYLQLSTYLTITAADGPDGFVRKSQIGSLPYVSASALTERLAPYATTSALNAARTEIKNDTLLSVSAGYVSKERFEREMSAIKVESGAFSLVSPVKVGGAYPLSDRANNRIVLTGTEDSVTVKLPGRTGNASRDFLLIVGFSGTPTPWGLTGFTVGVTTDDAVVPSMFSFDPDVFNVDMTQTVPTDTLVTFGFNETAPDEFIVVRKSMTRLGVGG